MERDFKKQKGVYMIIERNRFIFLKNDLHPVMRTIVMFHEIGHDLLHREEAIKSGGFQEFNIFNMSNRRMEFEANIFVAEIMLQDEEVLEYVHQGYDIEQIAKNMNSDINLVALKLAELSRRGYNFKHQIHNPTFLK